MKPSLLVVDDELEIRQMLQRHLSYVGYEVETAGDGAEALDKLADRRTDVVISDVRMPRMDGVALLEEIRAQYPMIRVIMITGFVTQEHVLACMRKGAETCIFKPFDDLDALETAIAEAVRTIRHWWKILSELQALDRSRAS